VDPGRQYRLAHQASARLNILAENDTAVSIAESPVRRLNARRPSHIGPWGPDNRSCRVLKPSLEKYFDKVLGTGTPLGLETALRISRAQRWLGGIGKDAGSS
jgi:hypothetical protein